MLDLSRQYALLRNQVLEAITRVCDSQRYILSDEVASLEREFAMLCRTHEAVGCASGTDALWLALAARDIGPGHDVITTPFSFFATAGAVLRAGARPVFVDIDPETLNIDPTKVQQKLGTFSSRSRCLLPVHLYGQVANMDALNALAAEHALEVIEDAAQAAGALWNGKAAGSLGVIAAFSFYPTKNLSAFGDAGALTTESPELASRLRSLRNHGGRQRYYHDEVGANSRLDAIQAAVLLVKIPYLQQWNDARREVAGIYLHLLEEAGLTRIGANSPAPVRLLKCDPRAHHIYHQFVIRVEKRDSLRAFLAERGIGTEIYYPVPLHLQQCLAYLGYASGDLPESEQAAKDVLALPIFPELRKDEQQYVIEAIADFYS
ncbi:MAG TPA: DegT/DnrJ/EryC1/StrS family aminotransferase [Candidatus Angelobacter sp.]|nr:DegT/DnrJ/EryC1/StrS family aminotransferase [Candidatus Angelobacter sp.]